MKITTTIKKTRNASRYENDTVGLDGGAETAQYTVLMNGHTVGLIDGGTYGYMESPNWTLVSNGTKIHTGRTFAEVKAFALSDRGAVAITDVLWS